MSDICILYARKDAKKQAQQLDALLRGRWSVWRDNRIDSGDYRKAIKHEIPKAGCIVPIWSVAAEDSEVLHDELELAKRHGVPILPIRIHNVSAPLGHGSLQTTDAIGWNGDDVPATIDEHIARITKMFNERRAGQLRPTELALANAKALPAFFFSVSSHETKLPPGAALDALNLFGPPSILISAYDMDKSRRSRGLFPVLRELRKKGIKVLLDSGTYEMTRRGDKKWTLSRYHAALAETPYDIAFCYDELNPPRKLPSAIKGIVDAVERDSKKAKAPILPIVHLPGKNGEYDTGLAPKLIKGIADELRLPLLAIPERELGEGIIERTKTMWRVRDALRHLPFYQPIHILGTGDPISVALLSAAGADSFDGLEWCRYVLDGKGHSLRHFQHYDLHKWQDKFAISPVTRGAIEDNKVRYSGRTVFHNLDIYTSFLDKLRAAMRDEKRLVELMTKLLPEEAMPLVRDALPGVL